MSTTITKGIQGMPAPTSSKAPSFDGETSDLLEFFEIFDDLAKSCGLSDAEKCKTVVRYVDKTTKLFWVRLKGYQSQDFTEFKKSIFYQYPGAENGVSYTLRDLERVVTAPTNDDITTETKLVYYYHRFYPIAEWLVENKRISKDQRNRYFWQGLPPALRRRIELRLEHKKADYSRDEATDFNEIVEAGRFVLSDKAFDADGDDLISARIKAIRAERSTTTSITDKPTGCSTRPPPAPLQASDDEDEDRDSRRKDAPRDVRTKRVNLNSSAVSKLHMDEVEELSRKMHTLDISEVTYSALFSRLVLLAPAVAQHWAPPSSRQLQGSRMQLAAAVAALICHFCGGPHLVRDCAYAEECIRSALIVRINGYLAFPGGARIHRHPTTGNLKDSVDDHFKQHNVTSAAPSAAWEFKRDPAASSSCRNQCSHRPRPMPDSLGGAGPSACRAW